MGHWRGHGTLTQRDGCQVIENIHAPVGDFVLRVGGQGVNHAIIWRDSRVSLSEIAAGQAVRVRAAPRSLAHRLWRRLGPAPGHTQAIGAVDGRGRGSGLRGNRRCGRDRTLNWSPAVARVVSVLAVGLSLFQLYTAGLGAMTALVQRAVQPGGDSGTHVHYPPDVPQGSERPA